MKIEEELKVTFQNEYHKTFVNIIYTSKLLGSRFAKSIKGYGITET